LSAVVIVQPDTVVRQHRERFRLYWRWRGSVRRECLDYVIVLGEGHLSKIIKLCADYHNRVRTQRRAKFIAPPIRTGTIVAIPMLGGLHHHIPSDLIFR
jgi:hypothetical protein